MSEMKCPRNRTANNPLNAPRGHLQTPLLAQPGQASQESAHGRDRYEYPQSFSSIHTQAAGRREHQGSAERCHWLNRLWQGCPAAKRGREPLLLKPQIGERSKETELPIPSFAFSCVESTKFSSAGGIPRVERNRPLYNCAAIFSPQGDSAKSKMSKMSTGQGCHQQGSTCRRPVPGSSIYFWAEWCRDDRKKCTGEGLEEPELVWAALVMRDMPWAQPQTWKPKVAVS